MRLSDDDITGGSGTSGEGPADGGANAFGNDGGADGGASGHGVADGGANPNAHDGGADGGASGRVRRRPDGRWREPAGRRRWRRRWRGRRVR